MLLDCEKYFHAFKIWLDHAIPEGDYSEIAKRMYPELSKAAATRKFRRLRNTTAKWNLNDICCLANALGSDPPRILTEVHGIYQTMRGRPKEGLKRPLEKRPRPGGSKKWAI